MPKTGLTLLLPLLFFAAGVTKVEALGKGLPVATEPKALVCDTLQSNLILKSKPCEDKKLTQIENAVIAAVKDGVETNPVTFSYKTESVYFVEPTPTPLEAQQEVKQVIASEITVNPILQAPQDLLPAEGANLDSNLIFDMINSHRASIGKPAFIKDEALCSLAVTRSLELSGEFANGSLHSGLYNRNLPYWITENAKWGSNEAGTVKWWLNSPIHRAAIQGDHTHSCGACSGTQCSQLFTSYTPKVAKSTPLATKTQ